MPSYVVRLAEDEYVYFCTVGEEPVSQVLTRAVATEEWGEDRVQRADESGASVIPSILRPDGTDEASIDRWLEGESLNQPEPWTVKRIRVEVGYG